MAGAGTIAKPQLRGLLASKLKVAVIGACITSVVSGVIWNFTVMEPRKRAYAEFYKTYDDEKQLKIMCDAGLLQSCGPSN